MGSVAFCQKTGYRVGASFSSRSLYSLEVLGTFSSVCQESVLRSQGTALGRTLDMEGLEPAALPEACLAVWS